LPNLTKSSLTTAGRASRARKVELLENVSLFTECSKRELAQIADATVEVRVPSGTVVVEQGAPGDKFYVIAEGLAYVTLDGKKVASIHPGSFFGEMALLDQGPRTATVTAELPTRLLVLDSRSFVAVVKDNPSVALKIMRGLAERLRAAEAAPTH
jgi:CRP/FNR family cyclic AMP-dependent transcriptional regulator